MDDEPKPVMTEVAAAGDGDELIEGFVGELKVPRDEILRTKGGGDLRVYDPLLRDDQVHACWQQRRRAVIAREWEVLPGGSGRDDRRAAKFVEEQLKAIRFDDVTLKALSGIFYGHLVAECLWTTDGPRIALDKIKVRRPHRFRFDRDGRLRLVTGLGKSEPMPARKFWTFKHGTDDDDDPYGLGLGHHLYWPVYFKRHGWRYWALYLEKYASPTALGKHPPGATEADKRTLLQALEAMQTDSAVLVPDGVVADLLQAQRSGSSDYASFREVMDAAIAKIVLSQTMTTDDGSSRAQAEVHADVKLEVVKADADLICESFADQVIDWLTAWNFPGAKRPQVWRAVEEPEDLKLRSERDKNIMALGFRPSEDYIRATYGDGWERSPEPAPESSQGATAADGPPLLQRRGATAPQAQPPTEFAETTAIDALGSDWEPVTGPMVAPIEREVEAATSFADLQERLDRLAAEGLEIDALAERLARTMFLGRAAGEAGAELEDLGDG